VTLARAGRRALQIHWRAQNGTPGQGRSLTGADAQDLFIPVPPGTIIRRKDAGEVCLLTLIPALDSSFGTYVKIGAIQRRLAWPLRKDDTINTINPDPCT